MNMNEEEQNVEKKKKKKLPYFIIFVLILLSMICFGAYYCYEFGLFQLKEETVNIKEKNKKNTEEIKKQTPSRFAFLNKSDNYVLYLASDKYFETGQKDVIANSNNMYAVASYKNKLYYIDDSKKLTIYDIDTKQSEQYPITSIELNYNTSILPGEKYVIISNVLRFELINVEEKTNTLLGELNDRGSGLLDNDNNTLYHSRAKTLRFKNIETGASDEIQGVNGYAIYQDDNYIYIDGENENNIDEFHSYDKKSHKIEKLNIKDYNEFVSGITTITKIDNDLYLTFNNNEKLIKYSNNKESFILEKDFIRFFNINNKLYIASAELKCSELCGPGEFNEFYIYDPKKGKLENTNNQYIKELFNSYQPVIYELR